MSGIQAATCKLREVLTRMKAATTMLAQAYCPVCEKLELEKSDPCQLSLRSRGW